MTVPLPSCLLVKVRIREQENKQKATTETCSSIVAVKDLRVTASACPYLLKISVDWRRHTNIMHDASSHVGNVSPYCFSISGLRMMACNTAFVPLSPRFGFALQEVQFMGRAAIKFAV